MSTGHTGLIKQKFTRNVLGLAISTLLPMGYVSAQEVKELAVSEANAESQSSYKVNESTSVKYTQPLLDTAKTINVISQSVMQDRNVDSLQDALRNVPGISMAAGEGGAPPGDSMYIRGFSAANSILIDGVRDIAGYARDTYNIEAVEVAKGPSSAVYGRGSAGGTINLQSKTAKLEEFTDASLRIGSEGDYRAQVDANIVLADNTALRVNVLSDDGDVAGRDEVFNSKNALAVSLATGIGTDSRFSVNAEYQKQDNLPDYGLAWVPNYSGRDDRTIVDELTQYEGTASPVDFSNFYGNVFRDFENITAKSITAKYEVDLSSSTMLRVFGRAGSIERLSIVNAPRYTYETIDDVRVYGEGSQIGLGDEKTRDTKDSLQVLQFDIVGDYQVGDTQHDVVFGIELAKEKFQRWNYTDVVEDNLEDLSVDLYHPDAYVEFTGEYARTGKNSAATGDTTALYIFDTITFNPQWKLSAGLRYDIFETEFFYDQDGDDPTVTLNAEDKELTWNIGVVYKPAKNGTIYFGAGTSFSPSAEDLTASTRGNAAQLDPEKTVSYELGTKWELFDGRLFANAAIFRSEKTNAQTDDPYAEDTSDNTLDGEQRVDGLELGVVGQLTDELEITAAYTFQKGEVISAEGDDVVQIGQSLARTPDHSFSLWASYQLSDEMKLGFGAQYMGERFNSTDPTGRETADDFLIFDMMLSYQINDKWSAQVNASNLTDVEYADQLGGGHFIPGEGRYISVSTSYSF